MAGTAARPTIEAVASGSAFDEGGFNLVANDKSTGGEFCADAYADEIHRS